MANLSQIKRQRMIEFLDRIRQEHGGEEDVIIAINEIENELTSKKYGLVWEEHEEQVDVQMRTKIPVFTEDREKEIIAAPGAKCNFLLEGDNLHSLRLLEKTHRGRIDLIYIDPPYNTGREFVYDDKMIVIEDGYKHSKWISFMNTRLKIARNLLSSDGVIFISIDDRELYGLKLLCDDIFGEDKFVSCVSWQRTYSMRNDSKGIPAEVEHVLVYSKEQNWQPNKLARTEKMNSKYKNIDNDPKGDWRNIIASAPSAATHQGMVYAIQNPFTGELVYPPSGRCWPLSQDQMLNIMNQWCEYELKELDDQSKRASICNVPEEKIRAGVKAIVLSADVDISKSIAEKRLADGAWPEFYFSKNGYGTLSRKAYLVNVGGRPVTNFWPYEETGHTDEASRELKKIFNGSNLFDTPKPVRLINRILSVMPNRNAIILDFFAGSGTTAQAVLELNAEDGGNRSFILCTNNENGICENVTYQRIKTVITGTRADGSTYSDGLPANLKYYRTDFIEKDNEDLQYDLMEHVAEMIQLEHGIDLENGEYVVLLDDDDADDLEFAWDEYEGLKGIYMSSDVLLTAEQSRLFSAVELNVIPEYYFDFELREASELL